MTETERTMKSLQQSLYAVSGEPEKLHVFLDDLVYEFGRVLDRVTDLEACAEAAYKAL